MKRNTNTKQKSLLTEEALKISETQYRRLFETAQDGILILDADTGQIDDVNPFLIDMLGYSYEDFRGKNVFDRAEIICDPERETIHRFQVPLDVITMTPEEFESGTSLIAQAAREGTIVLPETWESASNMSRAL